MIIQDRIIDLISDKPIKEVSTIDYTLRNFERPRIQPEISGGIGQDSKLMLPEEAEVDERF